MSSDFHIKLSNVAGESEHKDHKGEIEIHSWGWNVSNAASSAGGGMGKGKAVPGDLMFTHNYDKASPNLARNCVTGGHFDELLLSCRKAGDDSQQLYLTIKLKTAYITSVSVGGSAGGDVVETVTVAYKDIEFNYKAQKDEKGKTDGDVTFGWEVKSTATR